ncbi:MAG: AAA family ATPase [Anaerolineae bacterium]|nr:AAA family ATPase [Anaerolineae bacterium]
MNQHHQLLTTKLHIPQRRPNMVLRPRLTAQLRRGLARALTVISAPPGFGKTTLLSEWVAEVGKGENAAKIAWLSLDNDDNDSARFLSYLVACLQTVRPALGESILTRPGIQSRPLTHLPNQEEFECAELLVPLINEIAAIPEDLVLVLDDYHVIHSRSIHQALTCLLDHLPPQLHLIIAGRTDPPLPLSRLRARGQLLELDTADLRFTAAETAAFLNQVMGLNLSAADVAILETRTEGWIAGLQMAALSMQNCQDIAGFMASFTGTHRYIFDYLAEEVLQRQPERIQSFLLRTSILNRLAAPLCDAIISEAPDRQGQTPLLSQEILEYLEEANLFVIPLDERRGWYRYHHLFADFLRDYGVRQMGAQAVAALHRRAAAWFEQNDLTAEAVGHALVAADVERAVRLVEQSGGAMLRQSELGTLLNWLEALPTEMVRSRPRLSLFHAWALVFTGQLKAAEEWLQDVGPELGRRGGEIVGELAAIRASVAFFQRDISSAIELFRRAFEQLPEENLFLRGAVAMSLATACNLQGDIAGASWAFAQAGVIHEANNNIYLSLMATCNLAQLHVSQAQLHRAAELYRQALQLARQQIARGGLAPANTGRAHVGLGEVLYQWNELDAATEHFQHGIQLGQQHNDSLAVMRGYIALARVKQAQGDREGAFAMIGKAEAFAQTNNLPSWSVRLVDWRVRFWLARNDLPAATRWLQTARPDPDIDNADDSAGYPDELRQIEQLTRCRCLIAQNKADEALTLLAPLRRIPEDKGRTACELEILLLQALAYQIQNQPAKSLVALEKALTLAEPEGYIRLFIDEGDVMAELLALAREKGGVLSDYAGRLLAVFSQESRHPSSFGLHPFIEPLSDRELEVLGLIAAGLSNQHIAQELVLTIGTVKWHLSNIYSKLGVNSRTQAVARARELRLL